jgi:hypothetical protein
MPDDPDLSRITTARDREGRIVRHGADLGAMK